MNAQRNRARIGQSILEIARLQSEIETWLKKRRERDKLKQYHTQLKLIESVLVCASARLKNEIQGIQPEQSRGSVYAQCRKNDSRLVWLRRVWLYYRTKFDQRDDPVLGPILAAADEVVWSCYSEIFRNASFIDSSTEQGPAPLPYIEPLFSPQAIPRDDPPDNLESNIDAEFLKSFLARLPIPIVSLPSYCIQAPWWLIYLGHETGHHVQYDLMPEWKLVLSFGELLKKSICSELPQPQGDETTANRWFKWAQEIFADTFSVCVMGPWAVWAINELETLDEKTMLRSKSNYPAPLVRLALLAQLIDDLGLDGNAMLEDLNPAEKIVGAPVMELNRNLRQIAADDFRFVPKIAKAILTWPLGGLGRFSELIGWQDDDFKPFGTVFNWRESLLGRAPLIPEQSLRAPRLIASGAVAAWAEIVGIADEIQLTEQRCKLAEILPSIITGSREEGTRSASALPTGQVQNYGNQLADWLLEIDPGGL